MFNISVVTSSEKQYHHLVTKTLLSFNNSAEHRMTETCICWMVNAQQSGSTYLMAVIPPGIQLCSAGVCVSLSEIPD